MKRSIIIAVLFWVLATVPLVAQTEGVVISEVAWSGTSASWADEWIELYNGGSQVVDLSNWTLEWGETVVTFGGVGESTVEVRSSVIAPQSYYLLERSDDNTVANKKAQLIFRGGLSNEGELITLRDGEGEVMAKVDAREGWSAGTGAEGEPPYSSMELVGGKWSDSANPSSARDAEGNEIMGTPGNEPLPEADKGKEN